MKVSVNWLKQFTDVNLSVDELVQKIGAQLGAVEEVTDLGQRYQGIVVAKVVSCEKHSDADKLSVCKIDDDGVVAGVERDKKGHIQVVCGAPNVRAGLLVAWLPPGSVVPATIDKDPLTLEARNIRGVVSNGMLASAHELGIGDDHSGIVEVDIEARPGTAFAEVYELDDTVIDIENKMFTHRPDCFGMLGVAREVAGIQGIPFKSPDWYLKALDRIRPGKTKLELEVQNELPELVPRFMMVALANVEVKPSPLIIRTYLSRLGLKPINNIVDITNYLMILTGQPLHAFDYDKVKAKSGKQGAKVVVRHPVAGEKIKLLGGKVITPHESAIMIATNKELIGIGGVMGGADTEVDNDTKNIILECANFDLYSIRKTAMAHGLFTDAVTRFTKGQSPHQNDRVLEEAVAMLMSLADAEVASLVFDLKTDLPEPKPVRVTAEFINARLGLKLSRKEIQALLANVEFAVELPDNDELKVTPPFWRTDIHIPEDIVEEIGRLHGYDHLPLELPKRDLTPAPKNPTLEFKNQVRDVLSRAGANEVLTYSFVHGNLLDKVGQDRAQAFELANALSPDLQYYRVSLTPSLLEKVHANIKAGYPEFALFEINKVHCKLQLDETGLPAEFWRLALVFAAEPKTAQKYSGAAFYQAKRYLTTVLEHFNAQAEVTWQPLKDGLTEYPLIEQMLKPYEPQRSAVIMKGDLIVGVVGEYRPSVQKALKLPAFAAGFESFHSYLQNQPSSSRYKPIPRFPKVEQDISLKVPTEITYGALFELLSNELANRQPDQTAASLVPLDIYQHGKKRTEKHISFRLTIASHQRTLTAGVVNQLLDELAAAAKNTFGAERI